MQNVHWNCLLELYYYYSTYIANFDMPLLIGSISLSAKYSLTTPGRDL